MPDRNARVVIVSPGDYDRMLGAEETEGQGREVAAVVSAFYRPVLLVGEVTERELGAALKDGADGFWFAGHATGGDKGGLVLSDEVLPIKALGQYLGRAAVRWSFLNGCDTGDLVNQLQAVHPHDVYANIVKDVHDKDATRNAILFAQGIASGGSIREAYRVVVAGVASTLRFFPSPYPGGTSVQHNHDYEKRLQRLERIVFGDGDLGVPSWLDQTRAIDKRMQRIEYGLAIATFLLLAALISSAGWVPGT